MIGVLALCPVPSELKEKLKGQPLVSILRPFRHVKCEAGNFGDIALEIIETQIAPQRWIRWRFHSGKGRSDFFKLIFFTQMNRFRKV